MKGRSNDNTSKQSHFHGSSTPDKLGSGGGGPELNKSMITKFKQIETFGIFSKWTWPAGLADFKRYNVLYGWNYSGKTTLSRVLRSYEMKLGHADYSDGKSTIEIGGVHSCDSNSFDHQLTIRVFNEDYVQDNIRWGETIEPILMLGEENIQLRDQLSEAKEKLIQKEEELSASRGKRRRFTDSLDISLTNKARDIKNFLSIPNYDKRNLQDTIKSQSSGGLEPLDEAALAEALRTYRSTDQKDKIESVESQANPLPVLCEEAKKLLAMKVTGHLIPELVDDHELNIWVEKGKDLHVGETKCKFCGGVLPSGLLKILNDHFSDKYNALIQAINDLIERIDTSRMEVDLPDPANFYDDLRSEYSNQKGQLINLCQNLNGELDKLIQSLNDKKSAPFQSVSLPSQQTSFDIASKFQSINSSINQHNIKTDTFAERKTQAGKKVICHYAAELVADSKYVDIQNKLPVLGKRLIELTEEVRALQEDIRKLGAKLSGTKLGAKAINDCLRGFLAKGDLEIRVTGEQEFQLFRGEMRATNLSQGERTAISLAYFVTRLGEEGTDLSQTIVFIDDPVSSLDANHLFYTYSLIRNRVSECWQLFIATHNFEFFNLVKEWLQDRRAKLPASFYLVQGISGNCNDSAQLVAMPEVLLRFKSEYHYLFSILYDFHLNPTKDHKQLYLLPNLARRLLDAFLGFKIPTCGPLEPKLPQMLSDEIECDRVLKFLHQYSHNQSLPRSLHFPDFSECETVIRLIIDGMKAMDPPHFEALVAEIGR